MDNPAARCPVCGADLEIEASGMISCPEGDYQAAPLAFFDRWSLFDKESAALKEPLDEVILAEKLLEDLIALNLIKKEIPDDRKENEREA